MSHVRSSTAILTLRPATAADAAAISGVAQLDSAPMPEGDLLVALVDGRLLAALSLTTGSVVADPFSRTADLVEMLRDRAAQLREAGAAGHGRPARSPFRRSAAGAVPWARLG